MELPQIASWLYWAEPEDTRLFQPLKALLWPHSLGLLAELPNLAGKTRADPLVITVISVFIVMVGILGLVGFLRYRQHNNRMEFRRLQDLPMVSAAFSPAWCGLPYHWLLCSSPSAALAMLWVFAAAPMLITRSCSSLGPSPSIQGLNQDSKSQGWVLKKLSAFPSLCRGMLRG